MMDPTDDSFTDAAVFELRLGLVIIAVFLVLFLGWASFARPGAVAFARGQVAASGHRHAVQHREGGVLGALHVAEGDTVRRGQVLLNLGGGDIRAPSDGQVAGLAAVTPGAIVPPGQTLMEIVPADAPRIVVAQVSQTDIDNIRIGQAAEVRFPGPGDGGSPVIRGRVTRISAGSLVAAQTGAPFYRVEIAIVPDQLAKPGGSANRLRPGAPVEVLIPPHSRAPLSHLVEPLTRRLGR